MLCGGITVLIQCMSAVFGRLRNETLQLQDGLNIIEAPNETGKSTWCAFLTAMLYGINSRERDKAGFIADKNRYAPWDGSSITLTAPTSPSPGLPGGRPPLWRTSKLSTPAPPPLSMD